MKNLTKLLLIFMFLISSVQAVTFDVLVLPTDLLKTKENYYGFDEMSEIIANDIIKNFNSSNGKIKSPEISEIRSIIYQSGDLKKVAENTLKKYNNSNKIDYQALKQISGIFSCNSVLLVSNYVITEKNNFKRSIWDILDISTAFNIDYPYTMKTSLILIDTVNDIIMWSNSFTTKLSSNDNSFEAKNYSQASSILGKMKMYSKTVVADSASQNIMLRFYPKTIRTQNKNFDELNGGALNFDKTIPEPPKNKSNDGIFFGDMIYGL